VSLALRLIRGAQRVLGDGVVARTLARTGVARLVRWPHDRRVLAHGSYEAPILGRPARFVVSSRTQLAHIDALWREDELLQRMLAALAPDDVVYDVGANIGLVSLALALHGAEKRPRIHAFEPEPNNARALRANLAANSVRSIEVHERALGERAGKVTLFLDPHVGAGSHSLIRLRGLAAETEVELARADDLARTLGAPKVVKIDVEGAELGVLRGMQGLLEARAVRELFLEIHPQALAAGGADEHALRRFLSERGYVAAWQKRRGDEWHEHYRHSE
jgi:FkbM family methyltransferase